MIASIPVHEPIRRRKSSLWEAVTISKRKPPKLRCGCCRRPVKCRDGELSFPCLCRHALEAGLGCGRCGRCPEDCCANGYLPTAARALQDALLGPCRLDAKPRRLGRQYSPTA